jgi:SAM-dependent methyltransferase
MRNDDMVFVGSVPEIYDKYLVPLIFQPYATDLVPRLAERPVQRVLEIAAGTGVVTRALSAGLPDPVSLTATDLNQGMIDRAKSVGTERPVEWRQADAQDLPFPDHVFDAVVCQFGVMFFPDKPKAFAEARRVLKPGGVYLFSVWDDIATNDFADTVTTALASRFPADPPRFLARTPHGYHDRDVIQRDLAVAGFVGTRIDTVTARSRAESPRHPAVGFCQGTPLRGEIESRLPNGLAAATEVASEAVEKRFGTGPVGGKIQAHVVTVTR